MAQRSSNICDTVSVGLTPSGSSVLGLEDRFTARMQYPDHDGTGNMIRADDRFHGLLAEYL